uniref:Uncharacterized protein n=1 Tax=Anguilla anguilla TaxID=7936 RepID=A0A0E9RB54_ANGAN
MYFFSSSCVEYFPGLRCNSMLHAQSHG